MSRPENLGRMPPQNLEAEMATLGSALLSQTVADDLMEFLTPDMFYREAHQILWGAFMAVGEEEHGKTDFVTVAEYLRERELINSIGGAAYLITLSDSVPTAANGVYYGRIVEEKAIARRMIDDCFAAMEKLKGDGHDSPDEIKAAFEENFLQRDQSRRKERDFRDDMLDVVDDAERRPEPLDYDGKDTGFDEINRLSYGLQNGELCVIAARPSMGKTQFGMNLSTNIADPDRGVGERVDFFSIEMSKRAMSIRLLADVSGVNMRLIRLGRLTSSEKADLRDAQERIATWNLHIHDATQGLTPGMVRRRLRKITQSGHRPGMVVIDYLQLMHLAQKTFSRNEEVDKISRQLKAIAEEFDIPVIVMAQLNRETEKRSNKRPIMSDLRESGGIENNADAIWFIHIPAYYWREQPDPSLDVLGEIILAKERNAERGTAFIACNRSTSRFFQPDKDTLKHLIRWTEQVEEEEREREKAKKSGGSDYV